MVGGVPLGAGYEKSEGLECGGTLADGHQAGGDLREIRATW